MLTQIYQKIDIGTIASKLKASYNPNNANNPIKYYNVARVGSRAYYGDPNNGELNWYQSPTVWYTNPQDGLATIKPNDNSTILDTDGRVYPVAITTEAGTYPFYVTFANIGQFNDSGTLGRIMGGGDGKSGTMSGETYDQQVCYYKVCRIDDPDCGGPFCEMVVEIIAMIKQTNVTIMMKNVQMEENLNNVKKTFVLKVIRMLV